MKIDKTHLDCSQIFLVYMATTGCVERTALACDVDENIVRALAEQEGWQEKIRRVSLLSKGEKAGDFEKAINRSLCFAQAHLFRSLLQRILDALSKQDGTQLLASLAQTKAGQVTYSAKLLTDIGAAMEKAHYLSYLSLGDETANRGGKEGEDEQDFSMAATHASVLAALNHPQAAGAERKLLEDSIQEIVTAKIPPKND